MSLCLLLPSLVFHLYFHASSVCFSPLVLFFLFHFCLRRRYRIAILPVAQVRVVLQSQRHGLESARVQEGNCTAKYSLIQSTFLVVLY